jgi:hypothetical protein
MYRGGFLICAALAAVVIADARQFDQGVFARLLSVPPLRWIGTISYGLYLWHWPIIVFLNQARTGLSGTALMLARIAVTFVMATASYYLVELPVRRRRYSGFPRALLAPSAALLTALVVVVGTTPSVATPVRAWPGGGLNPGSGPDVPGAGGFGGEVPIALPQSPVVTGRNPLRLLAIGDSVMSYARIGIAQALESTGEVVVLDGTSPGWGLTSSGAQALLLGDVHEFHPQLVIGTWSSDASPAKANPGTYQETLDAAIRTLLTPGDGVLGVIFLQMPPVEHIPSAGANSTSFKNRELMAAGSGSWNEAAQRSSQAFPGRVMYLPVGSSLTINDRYTSWLPPGRRLSSPPGHWVRARMADGVNLCPPGITRYAAPVLEDLTELFHLSMPRPRWWESYAIAVQAFSNQNSGLAVTCPDDHPAHAGEVSGALR